jgi:hypothetical protein
LPPPPPVLVPLMVPLLVRLPPVTFRFIVRETVWALSRVIVPALVTPFATFS